MDGAVSHRWKLIQATHPLWASNLYLEYVVLSIPSLFRIYPLSHFQKKYDLDEVHYCGEVSSFCDLAPVY